MGRFKCDRADLAETGHQNANGDPHKKLHKKLHLAFLPFALGPVTAKGSWPFHPYDRSHALKLRSSEKNPYAAGQRPAGCPA
jgi:hypothetical protein